MEKEKEKERVCFLSFFLMLNFLEKKGGRGGGEKKEREKEKEKRIVLDIVL